MRMDNPIRCRIPDILKSKGQTQTWLADRTGFSSQRISDYCTMRRFMSIQVAKLIADELGVPIDQLYVWRQQE